MKRHTLAQAFVCEGVGVHQGRAARVRVQPAPAGTGLVFARVDLPRDPVIPARIAFVRGAALSTTLGADPPWIASVATVEHLLAALAAAGVDDARIEVDGPEVPVLDGSAAPFSHAIATAGVVPCGEGQRTRVLDRTVAVGSGARRLEAKPCDAFGIDVQIDFDHPAIGRQAISLPDLSTEVFARELAPARTFGFLAEVETLRSRGLARGASLGNTVVLDDEKVVNEGGLRFEDEFVRHKALDLVGDLTLLGAPLRAHVRAERGGHALHHGLVEAILARTDAWHWED